MEAAEFDRIADQYEEQHRANIAITGEGPEYLRGVQDQGASGIARGIEIKVGHVLDFGAGIGNSIPYLRQYLPEADLTCADVSRRSLEIAATRFGAATLSLVIESDRIPAKDNTFDLIFSACVFHHIPHDEHVHWLRELNRVTRPGGMFVVFEHNPLNPLTVRAVNTCPFDENAHLILAQRFVSRCRAAGWERPRTRYHLFFPRALAALRPLEKRLSAVPFGGRSSVTVTKPI